jgi:heme/copper-type cytochrome/quinol oxidase subunit 2
MGKFACLTAKSLQESGVSKPFAMEDQLVISAADGFVYAMLGMMVVSLSVIAVLVLCMRRNVARRDPHVDELLEEVAAAVAQEKQAVQVPRPPASDAWEREHDWWKK